jgi:hypothetical protein
MMQEEAIKKPGSTIEPNVKLIFRIKEYYILVTCTMVIKP